MVTPLVGGAVIGLAATLFWLANGRIAGVSGILADIVTARAGRQRAESAAFVAGLLAAGLLLARLRPPALTSDRPYAVLLLAGLLVGVGTRLARGCTSGHGVCGVSRLAPRSLLATATFIVAGAIAVLALNHLSPGAAVR